MSGDLAKLEQATQMLAEIRTVPEAANEIDKAAAARVYAQKAKLGKAAEDSALAIRLMAEKRMGELLQEGQDAGQIAKGEDNLRRGPEIPSGNVGKSSLADLGITAKQAHEAKLLAQLSNDEIVGQVKAAEKSSRAKVLKAAAKRAETKRRPAAPPPKPRPLRTPEEQEQYEWRQSLRDAFARCVGQPDQCAHPNCIDDFFQGIAERPYAPELRIDAETIRRSADRMYHIADEWKMRFPA